MRNVAGLLWRAADWRGPAPAIVDGGRPVTYATLRARATSLAHALADAGVEADQPVAVLLERGADAAAAYFAVLALGGIVVMVSDVLRPRQIEHVLRHSGARVLVTDTETLARQPRPAASEVRIIDVRTVKPADSFVLSPAARREDSVAQIVYTSGSTGLPKGVALSHANLHAAARAVTGYLVLTPSDRIAGLLPFSFVYGIGQLLCAVSAGATLVIERSPLPQEIVATLQAEGVTVLPAVPSLWRRLLGVAAFRDGLPALRCATNAGGHLPVSVVSALRRAHPRVRLYLMYGFTEAIRSTYLPWEEVDHRPDSIGRPIPGAEVEVWRDDGSPAAVGEVGELVHRGPTVALGYWKDPDASARVFRPDPSRPYAGERVALSGDLVRRDAEGFLYYVGRKTRMIKTMGFRVGPDEIADVLYASGQVAEAEVVGEPDEERGERIIAHVVLAAGGSLERLQWFCRLELPRPLQPARIDVRDALPLLPSGKHDVQALSCH